ncbi:multicopper oxidase domain-containing protein [Flavobacterium luteum]|uniref:Multicopper oxidase domain-containing protein n=1 Tax=Flavobacterium luteum TaxID=2026654 RepID=A0A7J5AJN5_9FLAO|nr:multicopper oxidase domain-containing protein [Flavobacterium luteum]KAB1157700.1 multicopper oxidase domain-containing protein [Flavobacterium luteum]
MKKTLFIASVVFYSIIVQAQYNNMSMPEALYGKTFNLNIHESTKQLVTGNQTITGAINNETFWGPTLFINKDEEVRLNVTNNLNESTTVHWHGMHLPAVMDGGPHQVIPAGTLWQPYWTVKNQASTLWYHPHLHETTQAQMTKGVGGFIIVRDSQESSLALPRTYGVDDIVLALTSRSYNSGTNTFVTPPASTRVYGDYMLSNGTPKAQYTLPKQYVRLRILNAEIERGYNLAFSDNRTFYIIANDGGLLNAPVAISGTNRVKLMVGERIEILVNLANDAIGSTVDLKAYNSGLALGFPGGEPNTTGQFGSLLNNTDFSVLHINVGATTTTTTPITAVPTTLATNAYWAASDATVTRAIAVTGGQGPMPFSLDNRTFVLNYINKTINLNDIEKWTVTNNNIFGHSFHVHDIEFKVVARNGSAANVGTHESGWKDTFYVPRNESVTFVGKFDDFADADVTHPYMYHCHFAGHEDGGMMGQFIVTTPLATTSFSSTNAFTLFPNPSSNILFVALKDVNTEIYYVTITTITGRVVMMLPQPQWQNGIDISSLETGVYIFQMMDKKTKSVTTQKFIKK